MSITGSAVAAYCLLLPADSVSTATIRVNGPAGAAPDVRIMEAAVLQAATSAFDTPALTRIVVEKRLYGRMPTAAAIDSMKQAIHVKSGRRLPDGSLLFTLSFRHSDTRTAQIVVTELASRLIAVGPRSVAFEIVRAPAVAQ